MYTKKDYTLKNIMKNGTCLTKNDTKSFLQKHTNFLHLLTNFKIHDFPFSFHYFYQFA